MPDVRLIILFGSAAKDRANSHSDVDVAILADGAADLDAAYLALAPVLRSNRLDLVDLQHAGPLLMFEVARSGVPLFEREPGTFRQFQSLAIRRYADTKKLRDAQKRAIEIFLENERRP